MNGSDIMIVYFEVPQTTVTQWQYKYLGEMKTDG